MKKLTLLLVFFGALPVLARWQKLDEAGTVAEKFVMQYEVFKDGTWNQTVEEIVRVQSEDGKSDASLQEINYNSLTEKVEIIEAYTLNGKQKIAVEPRAIEDRDKGESKDYDAMKVRSLVFPQVQVGSKIALKYVVKVSKPLIPDRWATSLSLRPGFAVERVRVAVKSERPLWFEVFDPRKQFVVKQKDKFNVEISNKDVTPGWVHGEQDPYFHPDSSGSIYVSTERKWEDFYSGTGKEYEQIILQSLPKPLEVWLKEARGKKTDEDKILFLLEKMSRDFRYFGDWRRHDGGFIPRPLAEIEKGRYGDCKDLSTLLTAMLRQLKINASVALVRRGENPWGHEPDYKLPVWDYFNHAIVRAKSGEKTYWLDPTNPVASLQAFPDIGGRPAFVLAPQGGAFDRLPDITFNQFNFVTDYEYIFNGEDEVKVKVKAGFLQLAGYQLANGLMMSSKSEVLSSMLEIFSEGQQVKSFRFTKEPITARILKDLEFGLDYLAGRITLNAGKSSFYVFPDGFLATSAFYQTADRESDMRLYSEPYSSRTVRRLKNTRLGQEVPQPCRVDSKWMTMERRVAVEDKDLVLTYEVQMKRPFIRREEFRSPEFQRLQQDTKRCFYRSGLLIEHL